MKINVAPTFFDSINRMINREKWYWKTWDFLRYDMPRFLRNLWIFRKDLYNYRWYSGKYSVLPFMRTAIMDMAVNIDKRGNEVIKSRAKKVDKMYRTAFIMERFIKDDFIELAEAEVGNLFLQGWEFEPVPDYPSCSQLVDKKTPEEKEHNSKVFSRAREIEKQMWIELWSIIQGQDYAEFDKDIDWDEQFNGTGLYSWWD